MSIVLTCYTKVGGPLTKEISLSNGMLKSDGSKCVMGQGHAQRMRLDNLGQLGELLASIKSNQALGLGRLRDDLPDCVRIITKAAAAKLNGSLPPDIITRTADAIYYTPGEAAIALIDFDQKGMPASVRARVAAAGGCEGVLATIVPELATCGRVVRLSTSTGIYRTDTGEAMPGAGGLHVLPLVLDGSDIERFLRTLHERCWAAGCGWYIVGAAGQLLERSLVDKMVYAPERLVFEALASLIAPLAQDPAARQPRVCDGPPLDTKEACPPLRISELAAIAKLKAQAAHVLAPNRAKARGKFISQQADQLASRSGISNQEARRVIARQCEGILLPDVVLPWDDDEFAGCTVADILKDPDRFVGATMADPLEGTDYGLGKAKVGSPHDLYKIVR